MKNKYLRYVGRHFIVWSIAFLFWSVMREYGIEEYRDVPSITLTRRIIIHIVLGIVAGLIFGSLEYFYEKKVLRNVSFGRAIFIGALSYFFAVVLLLSIGTRIFTRAFGIELNWDLYQTFILSKPMILLAIYCLIVGFMIDFVKQVDKKFGPGNLWRMLKGEFYHPKEDERIFMFLDLKSSTYIAERLGHLQYSRLIQDCFNDLDVVRKYNAEVYQYVGDEVVLTWKLAEGLVNSNCLRAYFDFQKRISEREDHYNQSYGLVPRFKAGLNLGEIVVAEVGEIKREIAYHGDTINTAARIQDQCNELGKSLLISESLKERLLLDDSFSSEHVGEILLKGKTNKVGIYSVEGPSL